MGRDFRRLPNAALLSAVSDLGEGMVALRRGRPVDVNPAFTALTGHSRGELLGLPSLLQLTPPEERATVAAQLGRRDSVAPGGQRFASHLLTRDGRRVAVEMAVWTPPGHRHAQVVMVRDITAQQRAARRQALQAKVPRVLGEAETFDAAASRLLQVIGDSLGMRGGEIWLSVGPEGMAMDRRATWWEPEFDDGEPAPVRRVLSHTAGGLPERVWSAAAPVLLPDLAGDRAVLDPAVPRPAGLAAAAGFPIFIDDRVVGVLDFFSSGMLAVDPAVVEVMGDVGRQIGRFLERRHTAMTLEQTVARLTEVAASDALTGLRNRREFDRLLATVARQRFAIFAIDVDNLKQINDQYGHEAGDVMLRSVGRALAACVRGWDVVARIGGDEFGALMVDLDPAGADLAAERMRRTVQAMTVLRGQPRISVGWAVGTAGRDPREVARLADAHLYEAKRAGRDRVSGGTFDGRGGLAAGSDGEVRSRWPSEMGAAPGAAGSANPGPPPPHDWHRAVPGELRIQGRRSSVHPTLP
jgi:diguanylate cyclase (GGDEF)-like protein/PAS domain S-box-containing protein